MRVPDHEMVFMTVEEEGHIVHTNGFILYKACAVWMGRSEVNEGMVFEVGATFDLSGTIHAHPETPQIFIDILRRYWGED